MSNDYMDKLKENIAASLNSMMFPDNSKLKRPKSKAWIALAAFIVIFGFLDLLTGVSVGYSTHWFYGVLVFMAGFASMVIHEALYTNAYANTFQKVLSVVGFFVSVLSTAVVGIVAIVITLLETAYNRQYLGLGMVAFAFTVLFFHGIIIVVYYFADSGITARQTAAKNLAEQDSFLQSFAFSEEVVDKLNALEEKMNVRIESGDGERMALAMKQMTGGKFEVEDKPKNR